MDIIPFAILFWIIPFSQAQLICDIVLGQARFLDPHKGRRAGYKW